MMENANHFDETSRLQVSVTSVSPYKVEDHMDKVVTEGDRSF